MWSSCGCPELSSAGVGLHQVWADAVVHVVRGVAGIVRRSVDASDEGLVTFAELVFAAAGWVIAPRLVPQHAALEPVPRVAVGTSSSGIACLFNRVL